MVGAGHVEGNAMREVRWSVLASAVYGGLAVLGAGLFALLRLTGAFDDPEAVTAFTLLGIAVDALLGTWILVLIWTYVDAERRGMSGALWSLLVFLLMFPIGPLLYLVLRQPPQGACPGCGRPVDPMRVLGATSLH